MVGAESAPKRGDIYFVSRGENTGSEQEAERPAVVVSNDMGNQYSPIVEVVYLTTKEKTSLPTHTRLFSAAYPCTALCEQITTVDKKRLTRRMGHISDREMESINAAIAVSLNLMEEENENMEVKIASRYGENIFNMADNKVPALINYAFELTNDKKDESRTTIAEARAEGIIASGDDNKEGYKGFLIVQCQSCGKIRGFCTKNMITDSRCECGASTPLKSMIPAYLNCKCGKTCKYMTNIKAAGFEFDCITCGSPIDVRLNKRGTAYVTLE